MTVGVPKETAQGERRVALVPDVVRKLTAKGLEVVVEAGAGVQALIPDALFDGGRRDASATPWGADVVVKVAPPTRRGDRQARARRHRSSASSRRAPSPRRSSALEDRRA